MPLVPITRHSVFPPPGDDDYPGTPVLPLPDPDNSVFNRIRDKRERAQAIARALTAGVEGADPKQLAPFVYDGLCGNDI